MIANEGPRAEEAATKAKTAAAVAVKAAQVATKAVGVMQVYLELAANAAANAQMARTSQANLILFYLRENIRFKAKIRHVPSRRKDDLYRDGI